MISWFDTGVFERVLSRSWQASAKQGQVARDRVQKFAGIVVASMHVTSFSHFQLILYFLHEGKNAQNAQNIFDWHSGVAPCKQARLHRLLLNT